MLTLPQACTLDICPVVVLGDIHFEARAVRGRSHLPLIAEWAAAEVSEIEGGPRATTLCARDLG